MATLFHLFFEIVRIGILSLIYGLFLWFVISKTFKVLGLRKEYIISSIFILLFIWRFSYWRNNGLGDFGRVPLTSQFEVTMIDFWYASIAKDGENIHTEGATNGIEKLYLENGRVYGQSSSEFLIFDSNSGNLIDGLSKQEFEEINGSLDKLVTPDQFHGDYWGWKILFY